ncbi:MAG: citrate synthase [delta proteobacterium ML8_F1]|nr:MAG: citrate synthase [delta proteobacterium ML8_F1]
MTNRINPEFYDKYNLKRGLRNENGTGVKVGLTQVSSVVGYELQAGVKHPVEGNLFYRGIGIRELVEGFSRRQGRGFEETVYLLVFGVLPTARELREFNELLDSMRKLPENFTENMILKIPSKDVMNKLQRSVLVLYSRDPDPDNLSVKNLLVQSLSLIARFPTIISYGFQAKAHYFDDKSLYIHSPLKGIGTAENILHMIRPDNGYTPAEAEILDLCLVLHADHGGGNNSAFATHVVSSSGTDTYSAIAAAVGCLKGPKHGGANIKVALMVEDIKEHCDYRDASALKAYLKKILRGEAFDAKGLIYGMGHAVYTKSDVRAQILKEKALKLAVEKGRLEEFELYAAIETLTREIFFDEKGPEAFIPANVDLYSGLVYSMLGIPRELFTPIFAAARVAGWCAHRMEQLFSDEKIIRPAYQSVAVQKIYTDIEGR